MHYQQACQRSDFAQQLNIERPHTLLTEDVQGTPQLAYRYDDTGEPVCVPNVWYNQTYQVRVAALRWKAKREDAQAARYEQAPASFGLTPAAAANLASRHRALAEGFRAEAAMLEAAGCNTHPVKWAHS